MYLVESTELNMWACGACINDKLWSAWRLAPGKGAQGPYFGSGHKNVILSQTTDKKPKWVKGISVMRPR